MSKKGPFRGDAKASVTGWRAGSGLSDTAATSANQVRAEFGPRLPPRGASGKMSEGIWPRERPRVLSVSRTPEALAGGRGRRGGRREAAVASPLPASGPSHSHAGPRPLGLLPPRGLQPPGEKCGPTTSCFRQRDPEVVLSPPAKPGIQRKSSSCPRFQNRSGEVSGRGASLAVSEKLVLLLPLASGWHYCAFSVVDVSE